jgi:hypothetical protein
MYIIKIFCDFSSSTECKATYEKICNAFNIDYYGENKKVYITDSDIYTHAIIINTFMPVINIPKQNVIGLAFEPFYFLNITPEFIEYSKKNIGKYFIGEKQNLPEPFVEHFGYMWYSRPEKEIILKQNIMSICVSEKQFTPGHQYRHLLIKNIINNNLPVHIFGRGSKLYKYKYTKGEFNGANPYEPYLFSICIENFKENHYFSEKIITPILFNCNPIYYGCKNIDKYFDNVICLTENIKNDLNLLVNILQNPLKYYKKTYNEKNVKNVNLIQNVENIFN